jgi:hypothetical protein
MKHCLH